MTRPNVTVLMSVYNSNRFLPEAVESILAQTYKNFLFLIIVDGSTDNSSRYLESLKDPRIKLVDHTNNIGLTKRLIEGVNLTKTPFLARMDADDVALPDRLAKQREYLIAHPQVAMVGCNFIKIDETGKKIGESHYPSTDVGIRHNLFKNNPFSHSCLFFQTTLLQKAGGYNQDFYYSQDYELVLRMTSKYPVANLPDRLMFDRWAKRSLSVQNPLSQAWCYFRAQFLGLAKYHYSWTNSPYLLKTAGYVARSALLSLWPLK